MNFYRWEGDPCTEQEFISHMRQAGLQFIETHPCPTCDDRGNELYRCSKTLAIEGDRLIELK